MQKRTLIILSAVVFVIISIIAVLFFFSQKNLSAIQKDPTVAYATAGSFSFVVIGDSEQYKGPDGYDRDVLPVFNKARELRPNLVFFSGDIITASAGTVAENYRRIRNIKSVLDSYFKSIPYYISFGFHDLECGTPCVNQWKNVFFGKSPSEAELFHSFDYQNTHFIILSSDYPIRKSVDNKQLEWLEKDLSSTDKPNKIVMTHIPPVTFFKASANDCHDMSCSEPNRSRLNSILKKYSVDLVISGHEHLFDHKIENGIDYVLSGNATGSKPRYKNTLGGKNFIQVIVSGQRITVKALKENGELIREIHVK